MSGSTALSAQLVVALRLGAGVGEAELTLVVAAGDSDDSLSTLGKELMAVEPVNHFLKAMAAMKIFS